MKFHKCGKSLQPSYTKVSVKEFQTTGVYHLTSWAIMPLQAKSKTRELRLKSVSTWYLISTNEESTLNPCLSGLQEVLFNMIFMSL